MKLSLVIPYINQIDITRKCVGTAFANASSDDWELVLIRNGGTDVFQPGEATPQAVSHSVLPQNIGVLPTFKLGLEKAHGDIIAFIHNDVLIHGKDWDRRIIEAFEADPKLGLAGFFAARGTGTNGGREYPMSHMVGKEWGACACHAGQTWAHHGSLLEGVTPAGGLDGLSLIFRREALKQLAKETDMFKDWRAPHHFYDRIMVCKLVDLGWHIAGIGIEHDHWSGATANSSQDYADLAKAWCDREGVAFADNWDRSVYLEAERQFFKEYGHRLPLRVDGDYNYRWGL